MIDIIIPVLNEEKILHEKRDYYVWLKEQGQIIFVDGGSRDRTAPLAQEFGRVIYCNPGRSSQMNQGALTGTGQYVLFLHVDTFITQQALRQINEAIGQRADSGCLTLAIDDSKFIFRIFEWLVNMTVKLTANATAKRKRGSAAKASGTNPLPLKVLINFAVALAVSWTVIIATLTGIPISTTHSLMGALVGAGLVAIGPHLGWSTLGRNFFIPLLLSPFLAIVLTLFVYSLLRFSRLQMGIGKNTCVCMGKQTIAVPSLVNPFIPRGLPRRLPLLGRV